MARVALPPAPVRKLRARADRRRVHLRSPARRAIRRGSRRHDGGLVAQGPAPGEQLGLAATGRPRAEEPGPCSGARWLSTVSKPLRTPSLPFRPPARGSTLGRFQLGAGTSPQGAYPPLRRPRK